MNSNIPFLYKATDPTATVEKIRSILYSLGLFVTEDVWTKNGDYLYSLRITTLRGAIGANGKGMSKEAALASAYAELIERIQNQLVVKGQLNIYLPPEIEKAFPFVEAPDEEYLTPAEIIEQSGQFINHMAPVDSEGFDWIELYLTASSEKRMRCLPFTDIISGKTFPIPSFIERLNYGSTGMCAGNTPHEALIQGISEIAERHAIDIIYHQKLTPPDIDKAFYAANPVLMTMLDQIRETGRYDIILKDCSLGKGLPVVAIILFNKTTGGYHVNFGAHPQVDEAISRTITEAFQGRNVENYVGSTEMDLSRTESTNYSGWDQNFRNLIKCGDGYYPNQLFIGTPSYQSTLKPRKIKYDLAEAFHSLKDVIYAYAQAPILIRDVSFLGFPAYKVIVPGLANMKYTRYDINVRRLFVNNRPLFENITSRSNDDLLRIKQILDEVLYDREGLYGRRENLAELTRLPFTVGAQWKSIAPEILLAALDVLLGYIDEAVATLSRYIELAREGRYPVKNTEIEYFRAFRDYLIMVHINKIDAETAREKLNTFYRDATVKLVLEGIEGPNGVWGGLKIPKCYNCDRCDLNRECAYTEWIELSQKLKTRMVEAGIQQENLTLY